MLPSNSEASLEVGGFMRIAYARPIGRFVLAT